MTGPDKSGPDLSGSQNRPKNHCLSDNGIQTIPRKQIHDEIPSEVDFFGPNSNFPQVQEFLLVTPPGIPCMGHGTRFYVDTDPRRLPVALRVRNQSSRTRTHLEIGCELAELRANGEDQYRHRTASRTI